MLIPGTRRVAHQRAAARPNQRRICIPIRRVLPFATTNLGS
jgi:hypothetical protein